VSALTRGICRARLSRAAVVVAALGVACSLALADVQVAADLSRDTIALGETVELTLVVTGTLRHVAEPQLPAIDGLDVVSRSSSQNVSFGTGGASATIQYVYGLRASRTGTFTIPPITLQAGGELLQTRPLTLTVTGSTQPPPTTPAPPQPGATAPGTTALPEAGQEVFATTEVDNARPYVGQQTTLTFSFYHRVRLAGPSTYDPPSTEGLVAEVLPDVPEQTVLVREQAYILVQKRTALFAPAPGEYTIGPAEVKYSVGFFSPEQVIRTPPIKLHARPLPKQGKPQGFAGAVGQFKASLTTDKAEAKAGEALTARLTVEGTGNLRQLDAPKLSVAGACKWYPSGEQRRIEALASEGGHRIGGTVTFEYLLIPRQEGTLRIQPVKLPYFDAQKRKYLTATTEPVEVKVLRGVVEESSGEQGPEDIRYIKKTGSLRARPPLTATSWFWLVQLLPLLALAVAVRQRAARSRLEADPKYRRFVQAATRAREGLREIGRRSLDARTVYERLDEVLTQFVADKLGVAASRLSPEAAELALADAGAPQELSEQVGQMMLRLREGRFAPPGGGEEVAKLPEAVRQLIHETEDALRWR